MSQKTFNSFMTIRYVQTFKEAYQSFMDHGMTATEAQAKAADTVRAYHGIVRNFGRAKGTEDLLGAVFFAPRFRESLLNMVYNSVQSVNPHKRSGGKWHDPAFKKNRKLVAGAVVAYILYNELNRSMTGHSMMDNPAGKEFELQVPLGNGENAFVPFMPSVAALPRLLGSGSIALAKGDIATAKQKFGGLLSMPLKTSLEISANQDWIGRPIYDEEAPFLSKDNGGKLAMYLGSNLTPMGHPFIEQPLRVVIEGKPAHRALAEALEIPVRFKSDAEIGRSSKYSRLNSLEQRHNNWKKGRSDEGLTQEERLELKQLRAWATGEGKKKREAALEEDEELSRRAAEDEAWSKAHRARRRKGSSRTTRNYFAEVMQ